MGKIFKTHKKANEVMEYVETLLDLEEPVDDPALRLHQADALRTILTREGYVKVPDTIFSRMGEFRDKYQLRSAVTFMYYAILPKSLEDSFVSLVTDAGYEEPNIFLTVGV